MGLPRLVNFIKGKEEGNYALTFNKIEQELKLQFKVNYEEQLRLSMFGAADSWTSYLLQIADLFAYVFLSSERIGNFSFLKKSTLLVSTPSSAFPPTMLHKINILYTWVGEGG